MTRYIQPSVRKVRDEPREGELVEIVLVPEDGFEQGMKERVNSVSGTIKQEMPFGMLLVEIPETALRQLSDAPEVRSLTYPDDLEVLSPGNR